MIKKLILLIVILYSVGVSAQDTIRQVYPPKHLYLPLSFGMSDGTTFGTKYTGEIGDYVSRNRNSVNYSSFRLTIDYNLFRRNVHAVSLGVNSDLYSYTVMDMVDEYHGSIIIGGKENYTYTLPLQNKLDVQVSGIRFAPYIEYNYAFKQDKRMKQSVGLQVNYGSHSETVFIANAIYPSDLKTSIPKYIALGNPSYKKGENTANYPTSPDSTNVPVISNYSGLGFQLQYDFLYVHTNFDDLRIRGYYSFWLPRNSNSLRFVNSFGIGLFLHLGRHFPKIDKF